uniref:ORF123 n=1 Tax=Oryza sativa subsp. japonica TaxID=39947 RepID=Q35303_ORYSJ|nr:ORF123 [Oryza sativa Japonica Group]
MDQDLLSLYGQYQSTKVDHMDVEKALDFVMNWKHLFSISIYLVHIFVSCVLGRNSISKEKVLEDFFNLSLADSPRYLDLPPPRSKLSSPAPLAGPEASSPLTDSSDSVKMKVISQKIGLSKTS